MSIYHLIDPSLNPLRVNHKMDYIEHLIIQDFLCPREEHIFEAFDHISQPEDIKVVILGQDPYPNPDTADGLAFSSGQLNMCPQSLQNILRNVQGHVDMNFNWPNREDYSLINWARQGVFLLNTSLTTEKGRAGAHLHLGWKPMVEDVIRKVSSLDQPIVWMLWGRHAQGFEDKIENQDRHLIIKSSHPSSLSASISFNDTDHFGEANRFLEQHGRTTGPRGDQGIDWTRIGSQRPRTTEMTATQWYHNSIGSIFSSSPVRSG